MSHTSPAPLIGPRISLAYYAWVVVALLWPVALLNYLDRQMVASMKSSIEKSIPSVKNNENWGYMLGQFKWVYAFLSPVGGYLADRFSRRLTICASLLAWSVITWLTGHVDTYEGLLWTRTFMGISEAFYIPAALALIADYHTGTTRSRAVGLHQMAIYCGIIVGGFGGYVAESEHLGWRWAFNFTGAAGVLYAVPLWFMLRDAPRLAVQSAAALTSKPSVASAASQLLTNGSFILLVLYFTLPALAGWIVKDWMPDILKTRFDISQGAAGVSATLWVNIASIFGAVLGGWAADAWMRRSLRGRIFTSALAMGLFIPALFGVGNSLSLTQAVLFLMLFGLGWGAFDCNNMPILSQIVRPELRATGYGIMNLVSISCGGIADWRFGELRDREVPLEVIFGAFSIIALLSIVLVLFIRPRTAAELSSENKPS